VPLLAAGLTEPEPAGRLTWTTLSTGETDWGIESGYVPT
jgi:hypothetical protein